jgi:hypothetical protein
VETWGYDEDLNRAVRSLVQSLKAMNPSKCNAQVAAPILWESLTALRRFQKVDFESCVWKHYFMKIVMIGGSTSVTVR